MPLVNYNTPGGSLQTGCTDSIATEDINHIAQTQQQQQQPNQNNNDEHSSIPNNTTQQTEEVEEDDDDADPLFSCQCDSARTIATLLSCLRRVITTGNNNATFANSHTQSGATQTQRGGTQSAAISGASANKIQHATVYAGPNGLTFHVQHGLAKQSQCSVDLPKNMFKEYFVGEEEVWLEDSDDEDGNNNGNNNNGSSQQTGKTKEIIQGGEFGVNLTTVLECFSILSKTGSKPSSATTSTAGGGHSGKGNSSKHLGEYASLSNVPLCMSYDRGTATFHLEFLEGGSLATSGGDAHAAANMGGGGCLVTCEVPGVEVSDDVDAGPDNEGDQSSSGGGNSGLAAAFRSSPLLCRAILYSDALHSAVNELYDVPGANIVQVSLSNKGIELGTVGPRSECWVNVPYNRGQGGMYVGLECYKPNVPLFGVNATSSSGGDGKNIVRRYSLSAFLSGMRGLDIGVETCISVNARGMMAIQHQVDRDGYYNYSEDGDGGKPSFVDFIMTCIEDEVEEGDGVSQEDASVRMDRQHSGLNDVTNTASADMEDVASRKSKSTRSRATSGKEDSSSDEEEEERPTRKTGRKGKKRNDAESEFGGDDGEEVEYGSEDEQEKRRANKKNDATSKLLGELEVDSDMLSSRRGGATKATTAIQGRKNALEDIRRRRQERQKESAEKPDDEEDEDDDTTTNNGRKSSDSNNSSSRKRRSDTSKARSSRKTRRSEEADEDTNNQGKSGYSRYRPAQDSQESQSEDDGEETENELDVTAEIPQLFSKRSSLSTSRHSSRGSNFRTTASMDNDKSEEEEQEPRMHYGDTKLEFTQDSDSD